MGHLSQISPLLYGTIFISFRSFKFKKSFCKSCGISFYQKELRIISTILPQPPLMGDAYLNGFPRLPWCAENLKRNLTVFRGRMKFWAVGLLLYTVVYFWLFLTFIPRFASSKSQRSLKYAGAKI